MNLLLGKVRSETKWFVPRSPYDLTLQGVTTYKNLRETIDTLSWVIEMDETYISDELSPYFAIF